MFDTLDRRTAPAATQWVIWFLLVAIPLCGLSATLASMLGASHFHRDVASSEIGLEGWTDFRRSDHVSDGTPRRHTHNFFQRHHHDRNDATVVALDGDDGVTGGDSEDGTDALSSLVYIPATDICMPWVIASAVSWPCVRSVSFTSLNSARPERPPQG